MKRFSLLLFVLFLFSITSVAQASLDFSVFHARGFEGKGELEFNQPEDIVIDKKGNFVVADCNNNRLQVLDQAGNFVRIIPPPRAKNEALTANVKDNRPANIIKFQNNSFKRPLGLAFDSKGMLYVTLMNSDAIAVIDYESGNIVKLLSSSGKKFGQLYAPMDIDIDSQDRIAVAEMRNRRVQIFDLEGNALKEIIYQEETAKGGYRQLEPRGVFWTADGDLMVSYPNYHQVVCWNIKEGTIKWRYGGNKPGRDKGMLNNPSFITHGQDGHFLITDTKNHRIVEITETGKFYEHHSQKGSAPGKLNIPRGLALTKDETLAIVDSANARIQFFTPGQATLLLKEAMSMALRDDWISVMGNVEKILYLQPNNEQAMDLMVNALYYFGDEAFNKKDFAKAEDYYRRVLRYKPDDVNIPQKLDSIFWETNRPILITVGVVVLAVIGLVFIVMVLKLVVGRIRRRSKE